MRLPSRMTFQYSLQVLWVANGRSHLFCHQVKLHFLSRGFLSIFDSYCVTKYTLASQSLANSRPSMRSWAALLWNVAAATATCSKCSGHYRYRYNCLNVAPLLLPLHVARYCPPLHISYCHLLKVLLLPQLCCVLGRSSPQTSPIPRDYRHDFRWYVCSELPALVILSNRCMCGLPALLSPQYSQLCQRHRERTVPSKPDIDCLLDTETKPPEKSWEVEITKKIKIQRFRINLFASESVSRNELGYWGEKNNETEEIFPWII
jgi:hypothetical protein